MKIISPQTAKIYRVLANGRSMQAKQIARKLHIFPNAVYRSAKDLVKFGLIEELEGYPLTFRSRSQAEAIANLTQIMRQNLNLIFATQNSKSASGFVMPLQFIRTRNEMIENADKDLNIAARSVNLIVSGHELPAETMLAYKRAVDRGVKVRALVQNRDAKSEGLYRNWHRIGMEVKRTEHVEARIIVLDERVVYFTSYDPKKLQEALGMRFAYPPYARLMDELFEQRWIHGTKVR